MNFRSWARVCAFVFALWMLGTSIAWGQNANTGTVLGTLSDSSGAILPKVQVVLRDKATGNARTATTNEAGRYSFNAVSPGDYDIVATATGFAVTTSHVSVEVGKSYTIDFAMQIGTANQTVEVTSTQATAELQTMDSTVGNTIGGETLMMLPSLSRNVSSLLLLQPASMPQQAPSQGSTLGGQVAGAQSDQNTIILDGGNVSNGVAGNSDYYTNFRGGPEAPIPTPVESIEEFKVSTNNPNASFSGAAGSQVLLVTKRGTNTLHGSAYDYLQNSALNANSWDRNRLGQKRPVSRDNRFGVSLGGYIPFVPGKNKTYYYVNFEGRRRADVEQIQRLVPSDTMRQGILRFRDASGNIVAYNLATSAQCGSGTGKCDPLGLGLNPSISQLWQGIPAGNDPSNPNADGLNTLGFSGPLTLPVNDNFVVARLDHSFSPNWQLMTSYRYFSQIANIDKQVDIGGALPGDKSGSPKATAAIPREPRYAVVGLTGQITPSLTNQFAFSFLRDYWKWITAGTAPQLSGLGAALQVGGEAQTTALVPMNIDTNNARTRQWNQHNYSFKDDVSWLKGNHLLQFGGLLSRNAVMFNRNDGQTGSLTQRVYQITSNTGVNIPSLYRPPLCGGGMTTNCLPSNQVSSWNTMYASALGLVDSASILGTRNAQLQANPLGTPALNDVRYSDYSLYLNDAWHVFSTLTVNLGLNWSLSMPPSEITGKQSMMVGPNNIIITPEAYLQARAAAAMNGQVYNPVIGFEPLKNTGRSYPWNPDYKNVAPRIAAAWNPKFDRGLLGKLIGNGKTVIRGGYAMLYDRLNGVQKVIDGLQGLGYQQTLVCLGPNRSGQCLGNAGTDPSTAFRIGVNGGTVPLPAMTSLTTLPLIPGTAAVAQANQPYAPTTYQMDPSYTPGRNQEFDFTIQREILPQTILEVGYINHFAHGIYSPVQLNQVPYFMSLGGQTFAQAYDAVGTALRAGNSASSIAAQPFFEAALAGSSYCKAPNASCTAGAISKFSSAFTAEQVYTLWNGIQSSFVTGPATAATNQLGSMFFWAGLGHSNYNAGFISLHERAWKGLTLDANLTYAHSLDNAGVIQDVDSAVINAYNLRNGYGTSVFDRKYVMNVLGVYELPFGKSGDHFYNPLIRNWSMSPIFTWYSGLPLKVTVGSSQEFGQSSSSSAAAVKLTSAHFSNSVHSGVVGDPTTQVATAGNATSGGTGLNLFANPGSVFSSFRPILLSQDVASFGNGGQLRGQARWNVDMSLARKLQIERLSATFTAQFFNMFNHVQFNDPTLSLQRPQTFGVISTQMNAPRIIELGLHLDF